MPINLECTCGKRLAVGDDQAGRKVRCPACQELVRVPGVAEEAAAYAVADFRKCPHCRREWPGDAVVCVECGYNFQTGKRMRTVHDIKTVVLPGTGGATLMRNRDGVVTLTIPRRFLFWTLSEERYRLDDFDALYTDYTSDGDDEDDDGIGPYSVELEGPRGRKLRVYWGPSAINMREVIDLLQEWGHFEIKRR